MKKILTRALLAVASLGVVFGATGCYDTPEGGQIIVVRNGGPFDNKQIRQVVPNGAGNTWTGWASESHPYPASDQQRIYKFDTTEDADAPPVTVPTRDGVRVRIKGTFFLNTAFNDTAEGLRLVRKFDTQFGTRTFQGKHPWEDGGWSRILDSVLQPVIDSNIREIIAEFDCKQLVSSCTLVQRNATPDEKVKTVTNGKSNVSLIQDRINTNLATEIEAKLGEPYFDEIKFSLGTVELPGVQDAIDSAQSAFAEVSKAQAKVQQAHADAQANEERQKGYNACPACQKIDAIKALPPGLTALGGSFAVGVR